MHSARWSHEEGGKFGGSGSGGGNNSCLSSWSKRELAKQSILVYIGRIGLYISTVG